MNLYPLANALTVESLISLELDRLKLLEEAFALMQQQLSIFANDSEFIQKMALAFGNSSSASELPGLQANWQEGDWGDFPALEVISASEINGALGAYAAATDTIYLSEELLAQNVENPAAVAAVLLEEYGHAVDQQVNTADGAGDEGSIFAAVVQDEVLSEGQLKALRGENDAVTLELNGQAVQIEQAAIASSNPFYAYELIAQTGQSVTGGTIQDLGNRTSINDAGKVALTGDFDPATFGSNTVLVGDGTSLKNISPGAVASNLQFGTAVQINNQDQVITAWRRTTGTSAARLYDANSTNSFQNIATGGGFQTGFTYPFDYYSILPIVSVNNNNQAVFAAFDTQFSLDFLLGPSYDLGESLLVAGDELTLPSSPATFRPMIADNGNIVVKLGNQLSSPILLYDNNLQNPIGIAGSGFSVTGQSPGISDDGQIVVFYADNAIWASIGQDGGNRSLQIIASLSDGFSSFVPDARVGVGFDPAQRAATVVFIANDTSGNKGIYSSRLNFFGSGGGTAFSPTDPGNTFAVSRPTLVAEVGQTLDGLGEITNLDIYDPVNNRDRSDVAFWVDTTGGEAVLRARPHQVIFLDFNPVGNFSAGLDAGAAALFNELGAPVTWSGNLSTVFSQLAPNRTDLDVNTIQTSVTNQVQKAFDDIDINVNVLSGNSAPIDGQFTRVYIGDSPYGQTTPGNGLNGIATSIDFFNQDIFQSGNNQPIPLTKNDSALVFVDNIFRTSAINQAGISLGRLFLDSIGNPVSLNATGNDFITSDQVISAISNIVLHEIGHTLGLEHLNDALSDRILNQFSGQDPTNGSDELRSFQDFGQGSFPLADDPSVFQNDQERLAFTVGSNIDYNSLTRAQPDPSRLAASQRNSFSLSAALDVGSLNVIQAALGIVRLGEFDALPEFIDLGPGDLATVLDIDINVTSEDQIILVASTDGNGIDVVGIPSGSGIDVSSIDLSNGLFVATNDGLRNDLYSASGQPLASSLDLFQITSSGPIQIGSIGSEDATLPTDIDYSVATDTASLTEGDSGVQTVTFTVTRSGATQDASSVDYALGGDATNGEDYANIGGTSGATGLSGTINFAADETEKTITVDVQGDTDFEPNEDITITLSNGTAPNGTATLVAPSATTTIENDDPTPPSLAVTTTDDAQLLIATLIGDEPALEITSISYSGSGTNASGIFQAGNLAGLEIDSGIILTTGDANDATGPNDSDGTSTANSLAGDADLDALVPGFSTFDATVLEFEFDTTLTGTISFDFAFASEEYNEFVGSAFNDVFGFFLDGVNGALIPGTTTPVAINTVNDGLNPDLYNNNDPSDLNTPTPYNIEYDGFTDAFTVTFEDVSPGSHTLKLAIADAGDANLDSAVFIAAGSLEFTTNDIGYSITTDIVSLAEGDDGFQTVTFTITRTGATQDASSVDYTIGGDATNGEDYANIGGTSGATSLSGTITFAAGETEKTITVDVQGDTDFEPTEAISVSLSDGTAPNGTATISIPSATTIIENDDPAPPTEIDYSVATDTASLTEGDSGVQTVTFTVTRSGATQDASTVDYTLGGDVTNGEDYANIGGTSDATGISGTINFAADEIEKTITVDVQGDTDFEADETIQFSLSNATAPNGIATISQPIATTTIENDDVQVPITFATLSTPPGDGGLTVTVDAFGAFGSDASDDAFYDPVGDISEAGTTFESAIAIRIGNTGERTFLSAVDIGGSGNLINPDFTNIDTTLAESSFSFFGLSFDLTQTVSDTLMQNGERTGSLLIQTYEITNPSDEPIFFELLRYLDGDLLFDGSLTDGGGRLVSGNQEILFETDTAGEPDTSTTFVGITGKGGIIDLPGRYEIDSYSGLLSRIISGTTLDDTITNDGLDPDEFVDPELGYDITLALRNYFALNPGESTIYTTTTIFGSGEPEDVVSEPTDIDYTITSDTATLTEGDSGFQTVTFTVTRTGATQDASSVDYTIGGSAINGEDYTNIGGTTGATGLTGTVAFAADEISKTITLDVQGDTDVEPDEDITITLSNGTAPNGTATLSIPSATAIIENDDLETPNLNIGLYDAHTDTLIKTLENGSTILASEIQGRRITIAAFVPDDSPFFGQVESMVVNLNNGDATRTENVEPYALFGDIRGDFDGQKNFLNLPEDGAPGSNMIAFSLYSQDRGQGDLLDTITRDFTIINDLADDDPDTPAPEIALEIGLYDTHTDTLIAPIEDGSLIPANMISDLNNVTIAVFIPDNSSVFGQVESIFLNLNQGQVTRTENVEPYALFGDTNANYFSGSLPLGSHSISLDLYSQDGLNGELLGTVSQEFTIM